MFNAMRTTFLLALLTGLFMAVGFVVAGSFGMFFALGVALIMNFIAYWNSDKVVLRMQRARELDHDSSPDMYDMVRHLSSNAGIPMPKIYLIESTQPNAFATGRNPENAAVAVSRGLLEHLNYDEIAAVVAHELAHIRSRDTLIMTITATFAGAISMLAQFGLFFGARNSSSAVGPIGSLFMVIVAPLAAVLVQMAVSRTREYEADRDGAEICGNPLALASALSKISKLSKNFENPLARRSPGMAHLYIINPLSGHGTDNLFSTHPNVDNRIAELVEMAKEMPLKGRERNELPQNEHQMGSSPSSSWRAPSVRSSNQDQRGPWG